MKPTEPGFMCSWWYSYTHSSSLPPSITPFLSPLSPSLPLSLSFSPVLPPSAPVGLASPIVVITGPTSANISWSKSHDSHMTVT